MGSNKFTVIAQLLRRDLNRYKRGVLSKLLDTVSLLITILVVFGYLMGSYGLGGAYGPFMLVSAVASFGFFDIVGKVSDLISDIEGDRTISYTLTMPIPSWLVFVYIGVWWAINSILVTIVILPIGKLILFQSFDLSAISYWRLSIVYVSANLFYGFFSLWLTSLLKNIGGLGILWVRVINPLLMFGAYFYSWQSAYQASPTFAYIDLINPLVYIMEGMRAAALGQEGSLPYAICVPVIWLFTFFCGWHATRRLQNRLDCVK